MDKDTDKLIEDWLRWLEYSKGNRTSTVNKYRGYICKLVDYLQDTHLLYVSSTQLEEFTGFFLHKQKVAPQSRKVVIAAVKGFFTWAVDHEHITHNPSLKLSYPKLGRKLPKQLGLNNAERLLMQPDISKFSGLRDATMIALLMGCGIRVSGLVGLHEDDLFWFEYEGKQRLAIHVTEKGGNERQLPVPYEAMLLLQAYLGHPELEGIDRTLPNGRQVLFVSVRNRNVPIYEYHGENRRLTQKSVWKIIQQYGKQAGVPEELCHPHAMRHMLGAELAEEDVNTLQMQAIFGHADPKTSAIYVRIARGKLTEVLDKANPLGKINTVVTPLVKEMKKRNVL